MFDNLVKAVTLAAVYNTLPQFHLFNTRETFVNLFVHNPKMYYLEAKARLTKK